ncbi:MAG: glucose 1-dehydrogenase [Candidatus Binatia bacterium]|nr:glucose 1-dehydrogenase [Candidatus Binatia bacterium]
MADRLRGKVALISGGARGQGAVEGKLFAREGAKVVLGDVLEEEGRRTVEEIRAAGGDAVFVTLDVTKADDWQRAVDTAVGTYGKLDILVNNAGILQMEGLEEITPETWERVMAVNTTGVWLGMKAAVPALRRAGGGSIINISSISGLIGTGMQTAYQASKGAVRIMTKTAAMQYAKEGIRVNSVHPGPIDTPMTAGLDRELWQMFVNSVPLKRAGTSEDIAYGVLYLASDESSFVTGAELIIDGGYTAQ